ncbi:MAG: minor capsid protein [Elusimicrobiota bacterium]|jgi:SPP1 gp7 family putative phage head morphogenesis protein|nr:minor capsid protein [Elusimicrobiota bacterium]
MKHLQPIINKPQYWQPLEKELMSVFSEIIYKPIIQIASKTLGKTWFELSNARTGALVNAVKNGKLQYTRDGYFDGKLNATLTKELKSIGAKWDKRKKAFYCPRGNLPFEVRQVMGEAEIKFKDTYKNVDDYLYKLKDLVEVGQSGLSFERYFDNAVNGLERDFQQSVRDFSIPPELTDEMRANIASFYSEDMKTYVYKDIRYSIDSIRRQVEENTFAGYRAENLVKIIQREHGVSQNKAIFLARQETSLLMSKFREERFKSAGVQSYDWSTAGDQRVRETHKRLNGRRFTWDTPPSPDGYPVHPGIDYNCRCIAVPRVE